MKSFLLTLDTVQEIRERTIGVVCKNTCNTTGAVLVNGEFKDCTCLEEFNRQVLLVGAGIPRRYWNFDVDKLLPKFKEKNVRALNVFMEYCNGVEKMVQEGVGVYIQGKEGLAKSALAYFVLRTALSKGVVVFAIRMSKLTKMMFDSLSSEAVRAALEWIRNDVQLLLIEEIEKDYKVGDTNTFSGTHVNEFFSDIYDRQVALIITSNITRKDLGKVHANNIIDRLSELIEVTLIGESYRTSNGALEKIVN